MADADMNVNKTQRGDVDPGQIDLVNRDPNNLNDHVSVSRPTQYYNYELRIYHIYHVYT